jgi:hypothetical protein
MMNDLLGLACSGRCRLHGAEFEGGFGARGVVASTGAGHLRSPAFAPSRPSRWQ